MSNPFTNNLKANLRTLLTAIGMVLLSFGVGSDELWELVVGLSFPLASAVWSAVDGNLKNVGSWAKKAIQAAPPLLVFLGWLDALQAASVNTLLLLVLTTLIPPSE